MDFNSPENTFILICPSCKLLAFDPKICFYCNAEIPSSTRVKIVNRYNRVYETTGYNLINFSKTIFAFLDGTSSESKGATSSESDLNDVHDENCACVKYLKTDEEVKKEYLKAEGSEVTETCNQSYQHKIEECNSNSVSACTSLVHPAGGFITIYDEDMACLAEGQELNDNIIDSYLNYVYHEVIPPEFRDSTHIFSACFNEFLMTVFEKKNTSKNRLDLEKSANKWVKNVDLFSKDFIFVPVNRRKHWYLAVICFITQLNKNSQDSQDSPEKNVSESISLDGRKEHPYSKKGKPCIVFFDSYNKGSTLGKEKILVAGTLKEFLKVLWNSKYPNEPYDWDNLLCFKPVCPQQENSFDCGLYLLQYVESFFQDPIPSFESPMPMLKNWFPNSRMANKRKQIKEVLSDKRIKKPKTTNSCGSDVVVLFSEGLD